MVFYCQNVFAKQQSQPLKSHLTCIAVRAKNEIESTQCLKRASNLTISPVEVCAGHFLVPNLEQEPWQWTVHLEHVLPMYGDIFQL